MSPNLKVKAHLAKNLSLNPSTKNLKDRRRKKRRILKSNLKRLQSQETAIHQPSKNNSSSFVKSMKRRLSMSSRVYCLKIDKAKMELNLS